MSARKGALIYLPRNLPLVGRKVNLTVTEDPKNEVTCTAEVIRLERNAAHPQAALHLIDNLREWKKKVWDVAGVTLANQKPEELRFRELNAVSMKVLVLGAGRMGHGAVFDLVNNSPDVEAVTVADFDAGKGRGCCGRCRSHVA